MFAATLSSRDEQAFEAMVRGGKSRAFIAQKFDISLDAVRKRIKRLDIDETGPKAEPTYGPVRLIDAKDKQCRYPLLARDDLPNAKMRVCGQKAPDGRSWCPDCARLVYRPEALARDPAYRNL